jgi:2-amino-4-hydroxy-6-hydroxymethyldihydropteridine diphosphokinase
MCKVTAFFGLGSNLGDRAENIKEALRRLDEIPGIEIEKTSSMYETEPVGLVEQPDFINAVAEGKTSLSPEDLLKAVMQVEKGMGRVRTLRWGPRIIDIDILIYDDVSVNTPELVIPHPRMQERAFVMIPLCEIAPDLKLDGGRGIKEIIESLGKQTVRKIGQED